MKQNDRKKGFTLIELVISFSLIAIVLTVIILCMKGIYRNTNGEPGMKAAEVFYSDIMDAAGDTPFDDAIRGTGELSVLVNTKLLRLTDYFAEPSEIVWDTETYQSKTLVVYTKSLLTIYITAGGPSFDKPPKK